MAYLNSKLETFGVWITSLVGTMWCAILFAILAISGLPQALQPGGIGFIQWFSTAFLQLVLLSIIMVGQKHEGKKHDASIAHHAKHSQDLAYIKNKLDSISK